jgi:hypothetical protein
VKRVVVLGLTGRYPLGGMAWQVLHHVIGFQRLGCDTYYVEDSAAPPYSPRRMAGARDASENVRFLARSFRRFDLADRWAYYDCLSRSWFGMGERRARELIAHADLVLNLCGASPPPGPEARRGCLAYVETDPVLDQLRLAAGDETARRFVDAHDLHFTYAWNLGCSECPLPTGGVRWKRTHPPVLVDLWKSDPRPASVWRTVATFDNDGKDVEFAGELLRWSKRPSFERVMDLPVRTSERLEIALGTPDRSVRRRFLDRGWHLVDPRRVSSSTRRYRRYAVGAKGEFSVEKEQNVRLRTGWFSDRTVCFLAAGRPCVVQDTGFASRLPVERGLLSWREVEEAADALERASRDYALHARAARELARAFFDAPLLLGAILEEAGL